MRGEREERERERRPGVTVFGRFARASHFSEGKMVKLGQQGCEVARVGLGCSEHLRPVDPRTTKHEKPAFPLSPRTASQHRRGRPRPAR